MAFKVLNVTSKSRRISRESLHATRLGNGPPNYRPQNIISPELAHGAATCALHNVVTT